MALSIALLTAAGDDTNVSAGSDYTTASITPTANAQIVAAILIAGTGSAPSLTSVIGNGITYTLVAEVTFDTVATPLSRLMIYKGSSASPSAGTIAIKVAQNVIGATWSVFEITGHAASPFPQIVANNADATATVSVSLAAFGSAQNWTILVAATDLNSTYTNEGGYSSLSSTLGSNPGRSLNVSYLEANDTSPTTTPNTTRDWGAIALELALAAAVSPTADGKLVIRGA